MVGMGYNNGRYGLQQWQVGMGYNNGRYGLQQW